MGNKVNDIQAMNVLTVKEIDCLALLLVEDGNQHIGPGHFLLAGRLHTEHCPLQYPLKAQCGLGIALRIGVRQQRS